VSGADQVRVEILGPDLLTQHFDAIAAIDREIVDVETWQLEHFLLELPGKWTCSLLAFDGSTPVAFAIRSIKGEALHGHRLAVRADRRRSGLGRRLFIHSARIGMTHGCRFVTVKSAANNPLLAAFHRRLGGRVYGVEGPNTLFIHDCARLAEL
jgi:GNAT superfamily N-acetyltransferase